MPPPFVELRYAPSFANAVISNLSSNTSSCSGAPPEPSTPGRSSHSTPVRSASPTPRSPTCRATLPFAPASAAALFGAFGGGDGGPRLRPGAVGGCLGGSRGHVHVPRESVHS